MWCPYTNKELEADELNPEHIVPLSLGGCDEFVISVCKDANSRLGTTVDGVLTNDPLMMFNRRAFDARGHSGTPPKVFSKHATIDGRPAQIALGGTEPPTVWDAKLRRQLTEAEIADRPMSLTWIVKRFSRLRFVAKVALSGGYFALGDFFRSKVAHEHARKFMWADNEHDFSCISPADSVCVDDPFEASDESELRGVFKHACKAYEGSLVFIVPTEDSVIFAVGLLGAYIGGISLPADTTHFPESTDFDLGHCIRLGNRTSTRLSFRQHMTELLETMGEKPNEG